VKIFSKPKVLVCVLTGIERHNWVNPDLVLNLISMARDSRFDVNFFPVRDCRPWEGARNMTIVAARQIKADWLVSFDNDNFYTGPGTPLDIIAAAGEDKHIIGLSYGLGADDGNYRLFPSDGHGACDGPFRQEQCIGGGLMMIRNTVWKTIPKGPWFRWIHAESETLAPVNGVTRGEDAAFCELATRRGLKIWSYQQPAGHYRTVDLTGMVRAVAR
jgi:hypothetical protein